MSKINKIVYYNDINIQNKFTNIKKQKKNDKRIDKRILAKISDEKIVDGVIIGYEDKKLDDIKNFECIYSSHNYNILIIRNIFDVIISRMILNQKRNSNLTLVDKKFFNLYYEYCLEYLNITSKLSNKICINYDLIFDIYDHNHYEKINKLVDNNFTKENFYSGFGKNDVKKSTFEEKIKKLNKSNFKILKNIINDNKKIIEINYKIYPKEYLDKKLKLINNF